MTATIASLAVEITGDTRGLDRALTRAERGLKGFGKDLGRGMTDVGVSLGLLVAPLAAIGTASIMTSIEFESAFANVKKTVGGTDAEMQILQDRLRAMATGDSPVASLENAHITLMNIATVAGSLGVPIENIANFAETVALLDTASDDLDAEEAATFIGHFQNITGMKFDDVGKLADTVVTLGNRMATTEGQVGDFATRLAPLSTFNWDPQQILGYSAALGSLGVSPELGGTNLFKSVIDLTNAVALGGEPLEKWATAAGMAADEYAALAAADPEGAFTKFIENLGKMDSADQLKTLQDLGITGSEQISTILRLAGGYETLDKALGIAEEAWRGNNAAFDEAFAKAETTQGAIDKLGNELYDLKISVGDALTGAIGKVATALTPVVDELSRWAQENPETVTAIATVTLAIGGLAAGLVIAGTVVGAATTVFGALATAVGLVSWPVIALGAAVGGLVALWNALGPGLVESWGRAFEQIGIFIQNVIDKIGELINLIPGIKGGLDTAGVADRVLANVTPGGGAPSTFTPGGGLPGHAAGLSFVPRNDYAASLHKGERVLSAQENRAYNGGGGRGGVIVVNVGNVLASKQELVEYIRSAMGEAAY